MHFRRGNRKLVDAAGRAIVVIELHRQRAPLSERQYEAIASLYGRHDPKYRDRAFCRHLFEENPAGPSFHVFAMDGEVFVGHYAALPLRANLANRSFASAKGEALGVDPERGRQFVSLHGKMMPISVALAKTLYDYALESDIELIHVISSKEVGVIHRMAGCAEVRMTNPTWHLQLRGKTAKERVLAGLQTPTRLFLRLLTAISGSLPKIDASVLPTTKSFADRWQLELTPQASAWFTQSPMLGTGRFHGGSLIFQKPPQPGAPLETVAVSADDLGLWQRLTCLAQLFHLARATQAGRLSLPEAAFPQSARTAMRLTCRLLGFVETTRDTHFFLRGRTQADPSFKRFELTPFLYASF